jgi:hypothetical protein
LDSRQRQKKFQAQFESKVIAVTMATSSEITPLKSACITTTSTGSTCTIKTTDVEKGQDDFKEAELIPLKERSITQQLQSPQFLAQTLFFCWGTVCYTKTSIWGPLAIKFTCSPGAMLACEQPRP